MDIDRPHEHSDILEDAVDLESNFYTSGYEGGYDHGRLHGLFEGREIGKEKAFEIWEEVGYYEGWALAVLHIDQAGSGSGSKAKPRAVNHARVLLDLIGTFPTTNPTPHPQTDEEGDGEVDLTALLSNIRARYKLLCASLGTRPRLVAASAKDGSSSNNSTGGQVVEGIEGPMKGVDTNKLKF